MLNILNAYPLETLSSVIRKHYIIEAMRLANWDRAQYLGDSDFVEVPVERLLSEQHVNDLRKWVSPTQATPSSKLPKLSEAPHGQLHTTHFSIIDKEGNRVATTISLNYWFGSRFVPPGTGVLLNDEMDDFSIKPNTPNAYGLVGSEANAIAPGKRPLSSMTPTFVEDANRVAIMGTPGGSRIISMILLAILDFDQNHSANSMVSLPRYHHQYLPDLVEYEQHAFSLHEQQELEKMGYHLFLFQHTIYNPDHFKQSTNEKIKVPSTYGSMQIVLWNKKNNHISAASDPRHEGTGEVLRLNKQVANRTLKRLN